MLIIRIKVMHESIKNSSQKNSTTPKLPFMLFQASGRAYVWREGQMEGRLDKWSHRFRLLLNGIILQMLLLVFKSINCSFI